jgi:hypothetical protein
LQLVSIHFTGSGRSGNSATPESSSYEPSSPRK